MSRPPHSGRNKRRAKRLSDNWQGPTSGRSCEWEANEKLGDLLMIGHLQLTLADRPEVDPCLRAFFRQPLGLHDLGEALGDGLDRLA
jgi:hypothetical protein